MASSVGNVADSTGTSVPFYFGRRPFGVWCRLVSLIIPFPLTIPITSVALLNSRVLLPSDRVWCCRPFRKHSLVACLHFACFWAFSLLFYPTSVLAFSLGTLSSTRVRLECLGMGCIGIPALSVSIATAFSPNSSLSLPPPVHFHLPPSHPFSLGHI